jgi:hypothetical protein
MERVEIHMIELLIHMETPSLNSRERWHWARQRKEVTDWAKWFTYSQRPGGLDKAIGKRSVAIISYRKQRCRDEANLIGGCKGMIDGLVRSGLLVDDSIKLATFTYAQDVASKSPTKKPCTRIVITEAAS